MKKSRFHKGFTLIELLIVISIISILATIIVVSYAGAQKKARDNKRRADVMAIASALQIYHADHKTWYIPGSGAYGIGVGAYENVYTPNIPIHDALEQSGYLNPAPKESMRGKVSTTCPGGLAGCAFMYMVYTCGSGLNATAVSISALMEVPVQAEIDEAKLSCNGPTGTPDNSIVTRYGQTYAVTVR